MDGVYGGKSLELRGNEWGHPRLRQDDAETPTSGPMLEQTWAIDVTSAAGTMSRDTTRSCSPPLLTRSTQKPERAHQISQI